jgi:hypothetical protein
VKKFLQTTHDVYGVTPDTKASTLRQRSQQAIAAAGRRRALSVVTVRGDVNVRGGNVTTELPLPQQLRPVRLSAVDAVLYELEINSMRKTLEFIEQRIGGSCLY